MSKTNTFTGRMFYVVTRLGVLSVVFAPITLIALLISGLGNHTPGLHEDNALEVVALVMAAIALTAALGLWRVSLRAAPQETSLGGELRFLLWSAGFWGYGAAQPLLSDVVRPLSSHFADGLAAIFYFTVPMIVLGQGLRGFSRLSCALCLLMWLSALMVVGASHFPTC